MRWCGFDVQPWTTIRPGQRILGHGVIFGNCFINVGCLFDPGESTITIGEGVSIGPGSMICAVTHEIGTPDRRSGTHVHSPVVIGNGAWLGASVTVLPGVRIGDGAVVAAGSVVTADVADHALVAGVPARVVRTLADQAVPSN